MCSKCDFAGHFTLDSPLIVLTHALQVSVECVQPVEVHVVQVVATHVLRQLPDVDITQVCRLLTGGLDVFPLVAVQHLLGPLCYNSENRMTESKTSPPEVDTDPSPKEMPAGVPHLAEGSGMVSGLAST